MSSWRPWWRKVVSGLAAILVVGFQMFGSVSTPVGHHQSSFDMTWSEYGMKVTFVEINPFTRLEEEIREESLRNNWTRGYDK